jgi:hypothetical protein
LEVTYKRHPIKGGFTIMYKSERDELMEKVISSSEGFKVFFYIENILIENKNAKLSPSIIAKRLNVGRQFVSKMISELVRYDAIMEIKKGIYMWNPYITLHRFTDGHMVQTEWNNIIKSKQYKRRGSNILDEYYAYKREHNLPKLTFDKYISEINIEKKIEPKIIKGEDNEY